MYICVFSFARPIPTFSPYTIASVIVAQTVLSVGPYALINLHSPLHCLTRSFGHASPATIIVFRGCIVFFAALIKTEGGRVTVSTLCLTINSRIFSGDCASTLEIKISFAPQIRVINHSQVAASKLNESHCNTDVPAATWRFLF